MKYMLEWSVSKMTKVPLLDFGAIDQRTLDQFHVNSLATNDLCFRAHIDTYVRNKSY